MNLHLDDRLLHGRILHAWGGVLHPRRYVLVTEHALAPAQVELFRAAAAEHGADFVAAALGAEAELPPPADGDFWLVDSLSVALQLKQRRFDYERLVITGLREPDGSPGGDFGLSPRSAIDIRRLRRAGVTVIMQPFPGAEPRSIDLGAEE